MQPRPRRGLISCCRVGIRGLTCVCRAWTCHGPYPAHAYVRALRPFNA